MTNSSNSPSNLEKGKFKITKSGTIIKSTNTDLLDILDLDNKIIDRNNLAKAISINRYENGKNKINNGLPSGKIIIRGGKELSIDEAKYSDILSEYEKILNDKPNNYEKRLEELDSILTERIILDSNNMIEFKYEDNFDGNKNAQKESNIAYNELKKLPQYKDKISLISKKNGRTNDYFIIKWTDEEIKKINAQDSKEDNKDNTGPVKDHEENGEPEKKEPKESNKEELGDPEKEELIKKIKELEEKNKDLLEENKILKDKLASIEERIKKLEDNKDNKEEKEKKEDAEKVNEVTRDLDNKDINYKKQLKAKVENMRIGGTLILVKGSSQIAKMIKLDDKGFKCENSTDTEFQKLIDKDHYIIENGNKVNISYVSNEDLRKFINFDEEIVPKPIIPDPKPEPKPDPEKAEDLELNAVISDMGTDVHRERLSLETEEELRNEYKDLPRYRMDKKAWLFLSRGKKRKNIIKEKMGKLSGKAFSLDNLLDEKTGDTSDRHSLELEHKLDKVNKENTVALENPQINQLCKDYLEGKVTEDNFKILFNQYVDADVNIQNIIKNAKLPEKKKMTHIGTNILEKLKLQKASSDLMSKVNTEFEAYINDKQDSHINNINKLIEDYIKDFQQNPKFLGDYQEFLSNKDPSKLKLFFKHNEAIMKMQIKNLKVKIDVLTQGKSAYQIDNKDRQKGRAYKVGNALDKMPAWAHVGGFVGLSIVTGLLTGGLSTVASAAIVTGVSAGSVGGLNALKKWTHYTKEQNTHEKNVATDYKNEQAKIKERQDSALNGKRYQWKTYKAKRQLALYDQSTQENFQISNSITDTITDLCSQVRKLTPQEENYIKKNLIQGKVRLDYYRDIGHNFLASNEKDKIEKDMKRLEKAIILGTSKLGISLVDITSLQSTDDDGKNLKYDEVKKDLENSYNKSLIQFKRERRVLAAKYGVGTAVASAGMSLGMQYLMGTGVFGDKVIPGTTAGEGASEHFNAGKHNLLDTGTSNNIHDTAQSISSNPNINSSSVIEINYGAGTDATSVIPGRLTQSVYDTKINEVVNNINSMRGLNTTIRDQLIDHVKSEPRKASRSTSDFTNDFLHGMRCAETVEQTARGLADSGYNHGINIAYNSSYDIVGTGMHNVTERVVNADFVLNNPGTGNSRWERLVVPVPLFFNTFKDKILGKQPEQPKKPDDKKPETPNKPEDKDPKGKDKEPEKVPPKNPPIDDKPGYWKKRREEKGKKPFDEDDFNPIPPKPFDKTQKIGVTPRAIFFEGLDIKPEDLGKEYPTKFKFKTPEEIADIVINSGVPLYRDSKYEALYQDTLKIQEALKNGNNAEAKKILVQSIITERQFIEKEKEFYALAIKKSFEIIDKKFNEIGGDRSELPDKSKIHIVGAYEFRGQKGGYQPNLLGFCSYMNGELFINRDALFYSGSGKLGVENDQFVEKRLIHTITHEIIHGVSTANYRHQYKDENKLGKEDTNNIYPSARRLGNQMRRFIRNKDKSITIKERGRALNEGITETLTRDIIKSELSIDAPSNCYPDERDVLNTLCKAYTIDIKDFYKVIINRKNSLKVVNKKLEQKALGNKTIKTPSFYTLLISVMDYEYSQDKGYKNTKALINGEQLVITPEMKKFFHPSLLESGIFKEKFQKAYPNILDSESKAIAA